MRQSQSIVNSLLSFFVTVVKSREELTWVDTILPQNLCKKLQIDVDSCPQMRIMKAINFYDI